MPRLNMVQALNLAMDQEMARDNNVVLLGEDIGQDEGVFRVTAGLWKKYGAERVIDTPLAESGIVGTGIGMAFGGLKPVCEIQFSGFAMLGFAQIEAHASRMRGRSLGTWKVPMVVRMPYGGAVRAMEHHSESREASFAHLPGLKVVIPSTPRNARALLAAAIRDPDTVIFMEPKRSYRAFREEVPEEEELMPIGKAQVVQSGDALTVVAWGAMMRPVLEAVGQVQAARGVQIEVIDLLTISPMDGRTLADSVKRTGRCVVVQEAPRNLGVASEVVAQLNDKAFLFLEAPVRRITNFDVVTPYFSRELAYIPGVGRIRRGIEETLDF